MYCNSSDNQKDLEVIKDESDEIIKLAWYTCDENYKYVLLATKQNNIYLVDLNDMFIVKQYEKSSSAILSINFIKNEPGTFYSTHKSSGRLYLWHVGSSSHKEVRKASNSQIMNTYPMIDDSGRVLVTNENGSISLYSVKHRKNVFATEPSHTETIFDVRFSRLNSNMLATCSYDSYLNIWDVGRNKIFRKLKNENGEKKLTNKAKQNVLCIYIVSWSPREENLILCGDSTGTVRLWDIQKAKQISTLETSNEPGDKTILGIDWNENNEIIITSANGYVYTAFCVGNELKLNESFKVGCQLAMSQFSPFTKNKFAVACEDGKVRIFDFQQLKAAEKEIVAHTSKCYGLAWSPKLSDLIATTGDDFHVNIHNLTTANTVKMLQHTNKSRWVKWSPTNEDILVSGSWDGSIIVWSHKAGHSVNVINQNYSDVYGLDFAPSYPNLLVSGSRDTSIRFWDITDNSSEYFCFFLISLH